MALSWITVFIYETNYFRKHNYAVNKVLNVDHIFVVKMYWIKAKVEDNVKNEIKIKAIENWWTYYHTNFQGPSFKNVFGYDSYFKYWPLRLKSRSYIISEPLRQKWLIYGYFKCFKLKSRRRRSPKSSSDLYRECLDLLPDTISGS